MKLEYYCKGDYRFTNQVITRSEMVIKKYGMLRKSFFKVYFLVILTVDGIIFLFLEIIHVLMLSRGVLRKWNI